MKFNNFRKIKADESHAAYFRNAVSKAAQKNGITCESSVQSFVSAAISSWEKDPFMLSRAYDYAVVQMNKKTLRLSIHDLMVDA